MTPELTHEQRRRIEELFHQAVALAGEQRAALLDRACTDDPVVRHEVEQLLHHHDTRTNTAPPGDVTPTTGGALRDAVAVLDDMSGEHVGPYKLLQRIGTGGFGDVYMADQEEPIRRRVALKIIKLGMDTGQVIARFEAERQALTMMNHPNIAKVLDAGATDAGRPYFVMELVKGEPITAYCDRETLSIPDRLKLFTQICHAVQHAHSKGVIHRDIKPSNVLVSMVEGRHLAKVIDFGIAKATDHRLTDKTLFTDFNQMIGTPQYMIPEQAAGSPDIDTRTDIYSLGVLLYELLTGTPPFDPERLRSATYAEMQRIIREVDPPKPSTKLSSLGEASSTIAALRRTDPTTLARQIRGDLDWIVMKCLDKDRARRYPTADGVAADILRHVSDQPVVAGPPTLRYRLRKFVKRHRAGVAAGSAVAAVMLIATVVSLGSFFRESQQRKIAEAQRIQAERIADFMVETLKGVGPSVAMGRDTTMLQELMDRAAERINNNELKDAPEAELRLRLAIGDTYREIADYDAAEAMLAPAVGLARSFAPDGADSLELAEVLRNRAHLLHDMGMGTNAKLAAQQALDIWERVDEDGDNPELATCINMLAGIHHSLGEREEAESLFRRSLEMRQRLYLGDHAAVAVAMTNLAQILVDDGRYAEAEALLEPALEMRQRLFRGDHPDVAAGLNALGFVREALGRVAEAEPIYQQALEMRKRIHMGDHPDVANSLTNLGLARLALGQAAAERLLEQTLAMRQRLHKGDHPFVALGLSNLASARNALGRSAEAETLLEQALPMWRRLYEGDHSDVALALSTLAWTRLNLGRPREALPDYEAALDMYHRVLPPDHPGTLYAQIGLAETLMALRRYAKAEPLLSDAAEQCERSSASQRLHWRNVTKQSVVLYEAWHAAEPGKGYDTNAAEWRAKLPPTGRAASLIKLGKRLLEDGRHAEAEAALGECLEIRQEALPAGHWLIFNTMSVLGESIAGAGATASSSETPADDSLALAARIEKLREAEALLLEGYEGMKDHPEAPDERKRQALERIVKLYESWHAAEPDDEGDHGRDARATKAAHATKAAEWRAKLEEEGTKAARHEGTKGKEPASQPAAEQAESRGNDPK